ncbi:MAG: ABC transporter ATP-binding protein [Meiothermus sp.]|nr:ABC transporter ATP-binding protein [Meiothermus sp.]
MAGIRIHNLNKSFPDHRGRVKTVLENLSLEVRDGEFVVLLGPSGCGKSTLLNILCGLDHRYSGQVEFGTQKPTVGYVFQEARLLPWLTVRQNIHFAQGGTPSPTTTAQVTDWLDRVGLGGYYDYYPNQLSIGMQHRVALARALILDPQILLLDEPFSSLDEITAMKMRGEVLDLWKQQQRTVVLVTHNPLEAVYLADRVLVMAANPGRIVAELALAQRLPRPRDPEDKRLWEISREAVRLLSPHLHQNVSQENDGTIRR